MYTDLSNLSKEVCESCGSTIQSGDLVYENGQMCIHDECFFDYIRMFVLQNDWRHFMYGDNELD